MSTTPLETIVDSVKHWYIPLIIGIILMLVGIYVFTTPLTSYLALTVLFSVSFFVSGLLQIVFSIVNREELPSWGWHLAGGVLYTLFGIFLMSRPEITIVTLPYIVGFYVLFQSVSLLGWSFDLKKMEIDNWGYLTFVSILGIIFSFILLRNPVFAGGTLVAWTGIAFLVSGIGSIMLSLKLKKVKDLPGKVSDELKKRIQNIKHEYHAATHKRRPGAL